MRCARVREEASLPRILQSPRAATSTWEVRRLTIVECCRLMGVPDDYLDITYGGKSAADGPRYRCLGNGFAVPCVAWIGKRIQDVANK